MNLLRITCNFILIGSLLDFAANAGDLCVSPAGKPDGIGAKVDLSAVLKKGQIFKVYNCLDITQTTALAKPVINAKFSGRKVTFPLRKDNISPDFDAFLVLHAE